ncbi:MAG TPA: hypothetical protein VH482_31140 [Thermomicrobiales bacterium]|jgi:hypothetical protein
MTSADALVAKLEEVAAFFRSYRDDDFAPRYLETCARLIREKNFQGVVDAGRAYRMTGPMDTAIRPLNGYDVDPADQPAVDAQFDRLYNELADAIEQVRQDYGQTGLP